jgi:hypothetical protein
MRAAVMALIAGFPELSAQLTVLVATACATSPVLGLVRETPMPILARHVARTGVLRFALSETHLSHGTRSNARPARVFEGAANRQPGMATLRFQLRKDPAVWRIPLSRRAG